jgi:hypothetical protein
MPVAVRAPLRTDVYRISRKAKNAAFSVLLLNIP